MEMESSRRPPFNRSGEMGMKKARLSDDPSQGVLQQYMQHQELINQYKTALAELTFNSKPIITNLTIIAGENLQAAKAIAATICSNILEVPSEQKLPSLYLLDSIVKNIGRDYIKCFAARLPEVFCKAYRQVNPSIHRGMRHLFGTWRGVFPPQTLQVIEKELGFQAAANGASSGSATSKADPQSQRQPHSIHVNPKYLEARERLQQSNKPQGTNITRADVESSEDVGIPERTASGVTERPWSNPALKMQTFRPQREALRESSLQKQGGGGYGNNDFASNLARPSRALVGKPSQTLVGQGYNQRWLGASGDAEESRNEYDVKRGISNYTAPRLAGVHIPSMQSSPRKRSSAEISSNWKNSEEEEYIWDDLGTGVKDPYTVPGACKEIHASDGLENLEHGSHLPKWQRQAEVRSSFERETSADALSSEQKEQVAVGQSNPWKMHEPYQVDNPKPLLQQVGARSVPSFGFPTAVSGTMGSMGQRHSSPGESPVHQRSPSPSLSKRDPRQHFAEKGHIKSPSLGRSDPRTASLSGKPTVGLRDKSSQNSMPARDPNLQSGTPGQSNVSSLLAAVMKTGLLSGSSVSEQDSIEAPATAAITSQATITCPKVTLTSSGLPQIPPSFRQIKAEKPPLPPGSPSSSSPMRNAPAQTSDVATNPNQLSSLFSSLLAKGLISSSKTEPMPSASVQSDDQVKEKSPSVATEGPIRVESSPKTSVVLQGPTDKPAFSELTGKKSDASVQSVKVEIENLIGFEFRPPVLRQLHSEVIDRLTDDVPHRCAACGFRFMLKEQLERHTELHAFRNSLPSSLNRPSRRWYSNSADWLAGKAGFPFGYRSTSFTEGSSDTADMNEKVVPADESQCVCLLCGELFEDFYSPERDEWMFKGAVYMSIPSGSNERGLSGESGSHNLIVHAKCSSEDSVRQLGLGQ